MYDIVFFSIRFLKSNECVDKHYEDNNEFTALRLVCDVISNISAKMKIHNFLHSSAAKRAKGDDKI